MTTPPEIVAMLNWQRAHAGELAYSQRDPHRLSSDAAHLTSPTDCSGLIARMYEHFAGLRVGTWTGNERDYGQLITTSKAAAAAGRGMLPGDVVLFNWSGPNPTFDHIAMYAGDGRIWNHGGPGRGPNNWSLRDNVNNATEVMVRRFLPASPTQPEEFHVNADDRKAITDIVRQVVREEGNKGFNVRYLMSWTGKFNSMETFVAGGKAGYASIATRVAAAAAKKKAGKR